MQRLFESRYPEGSARNPLFRLQPESWLQSTLAGDLSQIDDCLGGHVIYHQVPAFAGADRAMLDLLTVTRGGRLAILELKAGRGSALSAPGIGLLDSRALVAAAAQLQRSGRAGSRTDISPASRCKPHSPLMYYIVPALRVHPSMDTVLQHLSPAIAWTLIALNEAWRTEPKVIFRKRGGSA